MFNLLHGSLNQKLFQKHLCNQGTHYEKYGQFHESLLGPNQFVIWENWDWFFRWFYNLVVPTLWTTIVVHNIVNIFL